MSTFAQLVFAAMQGNTQAAEQAQQIIGSAFESALDIKTGGTK